MLRIVQDFKNWRDAKKNYIFAKTQFDACTKHNKKNCNAYPCFYNVFCDDKQMVTKQQDITIYETFCKDCSAFNVLKKKYESQKAKRKLLSNFIFWKTK